MNPVMADWANFFVAEVGASAALAGLVVVAISINLTRILAFPQLPPRAAESLVMLTGALFFSSLGLMPGQPIGMLGVEAAVIGAVSFGWALYNQLRPMPPAEWVTKTKRVLRAVANVAVTVPLIIGGVLMMLGFSGGLYWAAAGVLISLAAGVWSAWILLIEIMR